MKALNLYLLLFFFGGPCFAQEKETSFSSLTKNTTGIPYGKNSKAGKYYAIRGFTMYAETYGTGKPLLIIHGNGGSIDDFVKQIPFFQKNIKLL